MCLVSAFLFFNINFSQAQAAAVLGNVDLHSGFYGIYVFSSFCFQSSSYFATSDLACQSVYGINSKAGGSIFTTFGCGSGIRGICGLETGTTCTWSTYECIEKTAPTCTISAFPDSIMSGETEDVTVSWTTMDATSATLNGVPVASNVSGSQIFTAVSTAQTYTLAVTGDIAVPPCVATVNIVPPPIGGIVPCGRMINNPDTPYNETDSCTLCHIFIMLQIISTFVTEIGGIIAVFFLVMGGLIYATSAGNQGRMDSGKKAITWAIFGLAIVFFAWLLITDVLSIFGYINPMGGQWNIVNCPVP